MPTPAFIILPAAKGIAMSIVADAVGLNFIQTLIIATVSALLSGVFLLVATNITIRAAQRTRGEVFKARQDVRDVKQKIGADQRASDDDLSLPGRPTTADEQGPGQ